MAKNRLPNLDDRKLQAIVSLNQSNVFSIFREMLEDANVNITKYLRSVSDNKMFHVEQGAGQMLDEILETLDKAEEILIDHRQNNKKLLKNF